MKLREKKAETRTAEGTTAAATEERPRSPPSDIEEFIKKHERDQGFGWQDTRQPDGTVFRTYYCNTHARLSVGFTIAKRGQTEW